MEKDDYSIELNSHPDNGLRPVFSNFTNPNVNESCSTVIIGAGIIGCATAYYLSRLGNTRPDTIHLVEASEELFASASGKAGGFVAEDWFEPATAGLGKFSFTLHEDLAREYEGGKEWGYSRTTGASFETGKESRAATSSRGDWFSTGGGRAQAASTSERDRGGHEFDPSAADPSWLRKRKDDTYATLTTHGGAVQVDPLRLSQFLLRQSLGKGVRLHHPAQPIRLALDNSNRISGLRIRHASGSEHRIPCTRLLITAGAWTPKVFSSLFPNASIRIPISGYAGHSVVLRSPRWASRQDSCHALFATTSAPFSPDIFSRMGDEIYIGGLNDPELPLPNLPMDAKVDKDAIAELMDVGQRLLGVDGEEASDLEVVREGLCFRPMTSSGNPILARLDDSHLSGGGSDGLVSTVDGSDGGVFIAAGHGPWGISHSLGTGKVMSEMLEDAERTSVDVSGLGLA